jgi:hypothetical protein
VSELSGGGGLAEKEFGAGWFLEETGEGSATLHPSFRHFNPNSEIKTADLPQSVGHK